MKEKTLRIRSSTFFMIGWVAVMGIWKRCN